MNDERRELALKLRVGLFVLMALAVFLGMVYALGARARLFEARYTIHADFTEVGGLTEGATVRLAGVQIGRVSGVHLPAAPGGKVRVDLNIARRYADRVRKNSVARIETQGLLGDKIVEISVGTVATPPLGPGEALAAQDPTEIARVISEGAETAREVGALVASLRRTADSLDRSGLVDKLGRAADQLERGPGWAHALLYEEPVALRRLNQLIATTQGLLDRVGEGQGAAGVLLSPAGTASAKRFVAAMDRLGRLVDRPGLEDGALMALLTDPKYKATLEDLRAVAKSLREVSDRVAGGRGVLGALAADAPDDGGVRAALQDLRAAVASLRAVSERLNAGEGTLGSLLADPTVYERLVTILDGAQRSFLLRTLIKSLGSDRREEPADAPRR